MNAQKGNLINAVLLIVFSFWGYIDSLNPSIMDLIPLLFGVILLSLNNGVLYNLKGQKKAAFGFTIVTILFLIFPSMEVVKSTNLAQIFRIASMVATCIFSLFWFFKELKIKSYG